mgnify:CR=1 FL=1
MVHTESRLPTDRSLRIGLLFATAVVVSIAMAGTVALAQEGPNQMNGSSIQLDGEFGYASGASDSLNLGGKSMAVQMWVKHDGTSDEDATLVRKGNGGFEARFVGSGGGGPIYFDPGGGL